MNKRIDYLENLILPAPDVTGSVPPPAKHKRRGPHGEFGGNASRGN
jgi:hypothetical protein